MLGQVNKHHLHIKTWDIKSGNVAGNEFGCAISAQDLPFILGKEAGYGTAKTTKRNTATAELKD